MAELFKFLQDNIGIIGLVIGFLGATYREHLTRKAEAIQKKLEWQKSYRDQYLVQPLVAYVENLLATLEKGYADKVTLGIIKNPDVVRQIQFAPIEVRVQASKNEALIKSLTTLNQKYLEFFNTFDESSANDCYKLLQDCKTAASEVLYNLWPDISR